MVAGGGASVIYADTVSIPDLSSLMPNQASKNHVSHYVLLCSILFENTYWFLLEISPKKVGDLGYASELGNYAEYSGAPNEEEVLQYARVVIDVRTMIRVRVLHIWTFLQIYFSNIILCHCCLQCATADPDGRKRALLIGGGIANFTDVAATFNGIIRALKEKVLKLFFDISDFYSWGMTWIYPSIEQESKLKAARMHLYVRRGGPNYQTGLARMRALGEELGVPIEVWNHISPIPYSFYSTCHAFFSFTAVILYLQTSELLVNRQLWKFNYSLFSHLHFLLLVYFNLSKLAI